MATGEIPICYKCKNNFDGIDFSCKAFPKGIPDEIISGEVIHTKKVEGDNGIKFEKDEDHPDPITAGELADGFIRS